MSFKSISKALFISLKVLATCVLLLLPETVKTFRHIHFITICKSTNSPPYRLLLLPKIAQTVRSFHFF